MHRFYISKVSEGFCTLDEEESRHCVRVLRMKEGDTVEVTDGKGHLFEAVIAKANPKACQLKIIHDESGTADKPPTLIIAVAPTKNMVRMEWLVEKLTEIGFSKFIPVECHNSERKVLKTERLKRIALESMKQSGRVYLPEIEGLISFKKLINNYKQFEGQKFIAHCDNSLATKTSKHQNTPREPLCGLELLSLSGMNRKPISSAYNKGENAIVLIGPEGDFTKEEIELAKENGFIPVMLNEYVLRTETAALVAALSLVNVNFP